MDLMGPISGRGEAPPWALAPREALPPPLAGAPSSLVGFSPTWEGEEGLHLPLAYKRRGGVHLFNKSQLISFLETISLSLSFQVGFPLFWSLYWLGVSPPYARRCAAGIGSRIHLLQLLGWIGARGNIVYTVRV